MTKTAQKTTRVEKGRRIARTTGAVRRLNREVYAVAGDSGAVYLVNIEEETCECKDHEFHGASEAGESCKHLIAVQVFIAARRAARRSANRSASVACTSEFTSDLDGLEAGTRAKIERSRALGQRMVEETAQMSSMVAFGGDGFLEKFFESVGA